jgi:hypothetical protein
VSIDRNRLDLGVRNLLVGCAAARPGDRLLIVREPPGAGYYDDSLPDAVADVARRSGLAVDMLSMPFTPDADCLPPDIADRVAGVDHTLFLARIGDQLRFQSMPARSHAIVSYALDSEAMASPFGIAPYAAFVALKGAFNRLLHGARTIRVTCALGTDFSGSGGGFSEAPADVTIRRFPMSIFAPLDAAGFSGQVAVAHFLSGTGSHYYAPYGVRLNSTLTAHIQGGRLLRFEGDPGEVRRAEAHYAHVAELFGIDCSCVHSWHAGIHPGCAFTGSAHDAYERWSGSAFGNPRLLHFHTCGAYAPGEICWNVIDPTITVDGVTIWSEGRILIDNVPAAGEVLDAHPGLRELFERPDPRIGLGAGA